MAMWDATKRVIAWRRLSGGDIVSLTGLANKLNVPLENLPSFTDAKKRFLEDTKLAEQMIAAGNVPSPAEQAKAVNAFLSYISAAFSAVVNKQDDLLAVNKAKMLFLEDIGFDMSLVGAVANEAKASADTAVGAAAFGRLRGYAERNAANIEKVKTLLAAKPSTPSAPSTDTSTNAPATNAPSTPGSPDKGIGGKIAIAAAVLVGGFFLWKFFTRNK